MLNNGDDRDVAVLISLLKVSKGRVLVNHASLNHSGVLHCFVKLLVAVEHSAALVLESVLGLVHVEGT